MSHSHFNCYFKFYANNITQYVPSYCVKAQIFDNSSIKNEAVKIYIFYFCKKFFCKKNNKKIQWDDQKAFR